MTKYNVKKIENTNTTTTTLTTSCKKRDTAISRFCRFLSEYDSCFKDSMLLCTIKIEFVGYVDDNALYQATVETDEYYMTYTECGDVYQVIIEFKHDDNTTHYKSLANTSVSDNTKDTESDNTKDTESDTNDKETETKHQSCIISAYLDGNELTVPYSEFECDVHAIDYIKELYVNRVVDYDTLFTIHHSEHDYTISIVDLLNINELMQYNIDDVNKGLKNDCYKKVREGIERICSIITDYMEVCVDLHNGNNVNYCTITSTDYKGYYGFKYVKSTCIKKPSDFARWLYFKTFVRSIELKCLYRDLRGKTK